MDDQNLLAQYVTNRDAAAFEELVRRHACQVKRDCVRVLGDSHEAEEVTQECFLELARNAARVHSSVGGWLHRAAKSRSLNALRSRSRRKLRERAVGIGSETTGPVADVTTRELQQIVDRALTEMPEDLRVPMILHFFNGRSQRDVALELGLNQSTISRRMQEALQCLREKLTQAGYAAAFPAATVLLHERAASAATEPVWNHVAASSGAGKVAGSGALAGTLKAGVATSLPLLSYLIFGGWVSLIVAVSVGLSVACWRPHWVSDMFSSLGVPDIYRQPMFCLSRWDWIRPPADWPIRVLTSFVWSIFFVGLSCVFGFATNQPPWGTVALGLTVGVGLSLHAVRLVLRARCIGKWRLHETSVTKISAEVRAFDEESQDSFAMQLPGQRSFRLLDVVQRIGIGLAGVGLTVAALVRPQANAVWPAIVMSGTIGAWMLGSGVWLCRRSIRFAGNRAFPVDKYEGNATINRPSASHIGMGTQTVLASGVALILGLSSWVFWNPSVAPALQQSLASIQTSILGWMVYRLAIHCYGAQPNLVRRFAIILLTGCFVMNSGVCLANWLR